MAPGGEYSAVTGGGKLKLKGSKVKDGRIEKKTKEKKLREKSESLAAAADDAVRHHEDPGEVGEGQGGDEARRSEGETVIYKTEAERRYEEQRKKRLSERLKREGIKTHKERVEELNRYLSNLTEHHDMPKIGPG